MFMKMMKNISWIVLMFLIINLIKLKSKTQYNQNISQDINLKFLTTDFVVLINQLKSEVKVQL